MSAKSSHKQASYSSDGKRLIDSIRAKRGRSDEEPTSLPKRKRLKLSEITPDLTPDQRGLEVLRLASEAFAQTGSWVVFYREMLAPGGVVDALFPTADERRDFETTPQFAELLEMVASMRSQDGSKMTSYDTDRVITVRVPSSMHESIIREAGELGLSINKFCLTKLLQPAHKRFTPLELTGRRGRKPGPQMVLVRTRSGKPVRLEPKSGNGE